MSGNPDLDFLGPRMNKNCVTPLPEKVEAIRNFPLPQSQRQLRQFIGLVNFYHRFLPRCANLMQPLHIFVRPGKSKSRTNEAVTAFNATKEALAEPPPYNRTLKQTLPLASQQTHRIQLSEQIYSSTITGHGILFPSFLRR